jgi:UPF0755 protein
VSVTRRGRIVIALVLFAVFAIGLPGSAYVYLRAIGVVASGDPRSPTTVVIPHGASALEIGHVLESKGVVASAFGFRVATFLQGGGDAIQAGRYRLRRNLSARAALAALTAGPEAPGHVNVTFPEGSWITDFARILARATPIHRRSFVRTARSGHVRARIQPPSVDTVEGLLWPSTYQVVRNDDARSVVRRLVTEFDRRMSGVDIATPKAMGYSPYDVVIVASMVEAEARVGEDRPKIAAVIYNRLEADMPLGIDATVAYALGERKAALTRPDLHVRSPYNTRIVAGLPPTPIGAPGMASLEAAAHPAGGAWLYYVLADCDGHHAFSKTYEAFLADKAAYQQLTC